MLRRMTLATLTIIIMLSLCPQVVSADGMILPDLAMANYMVVQYHDVTVDIDDTFAITSVKQKFTNPHDYPVTGNYIFPIPPGAAVTDFKATFGGSDQNVVRQNRYESNLLLNKLIAERHDPSLLQYADWETLTFKIDLPANSSRTMTLSYQEILPPSGNMLHYQYVLSTERYSSLPLERASITVNISSSKGIGSIYSSSHDVVTEYLDQGRAQVTWKVYDEQPVNDFHLFLTQAEGGFGGGFLTGNHQDKDHFLFMFSPERSDHQRDAFPKDIVFVIDRSGSMAGEKIQQAQDALHFILDQLNPDDRFCILGFDDVFSTVADTLLPVNVKNLNTAHQFVSRLYDRNGTNIEGALQLGLGILESSETREEASQMIVFLTDGLPTEGITEPQKIVDLISDANQTLDARLHAFGVGYDVNTHLLDQLAGKNGGSVTYVQPGENLEVVLSNFYERIAYPVLTDLTIEFNGIIVSDIYPRDLPDLFDSSTLLLTGRYKNNTNGIVDITVRGNHQGERQTYTYKVNLADKENMSFIPGLWATRRIGHLLDIIRVEGESASLVEEVRELGLNYGLVTPYTTFIITAQTSGAASVENMALYDDTTQLNRASGQTTIQARVQNQNYQQATQVDLARGANVLNYNGQNLIQMTDQVIDLNLLRDYKAMDQAITSEWIASNITVDHKVAFGSTAYFKLSSDPIARAFMQSGNNVLFVLKGEVIQVVDDSEITNAPSQVQNPAQEPTYNPFIINDLRSSNTLKGRFYTFFRGVLRLLFD